MQKPFARMLRAVVLTGMLLCPAAFASAAEDIRLPEYGRGVPLTQFPGYSVERNTKGIVRLHAGKTYTLVKPEEIYQSPDTQWPDLIAHDFDDDGEPEFLVLAKATATDATYYLRHRKHGQGQKNYLFSHWGNHLFVNPVIDAQKRTITSRTSLGYSMMYAWRGGTGIQYAQMATALAEPGPLSERERELAAFFREDEEGKNILSHRRVLMPVETPLCLLPGAPVPDGKRLYTPGSDFTAIPPGFPTQGLRPTPDKRWLLCNMDHFHGYIPTYRLFMETSEPVTLRAIPGSNEAGDMEKNVVPLPAGTSVLLLDLQEKDHNRRWMQVYTPSGQIGWVEAQHLSPRLP